MHWFGPLSVSPFMACEPSALLLREGSETEGGQLERKQGSGSSVTGASVDGPQIISHIGSEEVWGPE